MEYLYDEWTNYTFNINFVDATVMFNESSYSVDENNGEIQLTLILSNPSSSNIIVQIRDMGISATSEL